MEKKRAKEFVKEPLKRGSNPCAAGLYRLALLLALLAVSFRPTSAASNPPVARQQSTGYWRFLEGVANKAYLPAIEGSIISADASVSEGQISYSQIGGEPEPQKYIVDCTWSLSAPNGLDRLTPGEMLNGSMTLTDQSQYYRTYDGFDHGYAGGNGTIYIDQPYLGTAYTAGYRELLNFNVGYQQSVTQEGQLAVPDGPGWDGKMGLKAVCLNSCYERVYEWVPPDAAGEITPEGSTGAGDETPTPTPGDGGLGWIVVVGGLAAVGAAALATAAAAGILTAAILGRGGKKTSPKQPPPPKYILQLSAQSLEVRVGQSAPLFIQAWRITPDGGSVPAPEAVIQVSLPPSPAGLVATPTTGLGTLQCAFSSVNPTQCAQVTAAITASAGGLGTTAQVEVRLTPVYDLQIGSQDPQNRVQPGGPALAAWAEVRATPPDPQSPPETLTRQITFTVQGPNSDWITCQSLASTDGLQWVQLAAAAPAVGASMQPGNPTLVALCMAGAQRLEARLALLTNEELVLGAWADGKKLAEVRYNDIAEDPGWFFGGLSVYFHPPEDDSKPVTPPFQCNLSNPTLQTEPADMLQLRNYEEKLSGWYGEISLREGVDLEKCFGPDLTEQNAQIRLTVSVTSDAGKVYSSTVTYQVCPTVELVARPCDEESGEPIQDREYKGLNLAPLEFLADGEDCLSLLLYYRRTDWPPDSSRNVRFGSIVKMDLRGPNSLEYKLGAKDEPFGQVQGTDGLWYTSVSSARPLLATANRQSAGPSLHVEGRLAGQPAYYRIKTADLDLSTRNDTLDQAIKPVFLHLSLWVIPGWKIGTSIAGAIVVALQANGEQVTLTREYALELCTQSAGPALSAEPVTSLRGADKRAQTANVPLPDWLKAWRLSYSGLQWDAIKQARFNVLCRFKDAQDAVSFNIDVEENGSAMFAALISDANQIDLTNPEWEQWDNLWSFKLLNKIILPEFRGPIYNIRRAVYMLIYGSGNMPRQYENYSCGDYSLRIRAYLQKRRHANPATALKMNGLEIAPYTITGAHDFAGIYLSGMHPKDNPIFIDPWYEQRWTEKATGSNYGYKFQAAKFAAACSGAVAELFLLGRFLWQCIRIGRGTATAPSLAEVMAALKNVAAGLKLKIAALLSDLASGGLSWTLMGPNSNVPEHDADFNYVYHKELDLFERYGRELEDQQTLPPVKAVDWPQAH